MTYTKNIVANNDEIHHVDNELEDMRKRLMVMVELLDKINICSTGSERNVGNLLIFLKQISDRIEQNDKDNEERKEEVINKIIWQDQRNEKQTENLMKAIGNAHKRTDAKIEENNNTNQENLRININNKDKIEKSTQMISDILCSDNREINNDDNNQILYEVFVKCCEIDSKINKGYQILK